MLRKVGIKLSTDFSTFEVEATTFGELKALIPSVDWTGKRVVVKETRVTLQAEDAMLPDLDDFTLFIFPEKVKSGNDAYDELSFGELRKECASRSDIVSVTPGNYGTTDEMKRLLRNDDCDSEERYNPVVNNTYDVDYEDILETLAKLKVYVSDVLDSISTEIATIAEQESNIGSALQKEYDSIKKAFGL